MFRRTFCYGNIHALGRSSTFYNTSTRQTRSKSWNEASFFTTMIAFYGLFHEWDALALVQREDAYRLTPSHHTRSSLIVRYRSKSSRFPRLCSRAEGRYLRLGLPCNRSLRHSRSLCSQRCYAVLRSLHCNRSINGFIPATASGDDIAVSGC